MSTRTAVSTPGQLAHRLYLLGSDADTPEREEAAVRAWRGLSFEVRDRWEAIARAGAEAVVAPLRAELADVRERAEFYEADRDRERLAAVSHQCPGTCGGTLVTNDDLLTCGPCWRRVPKPLQAAVNRAWRGGEGKGSPAHLAACAAAARSLRGEPPP